MAAVQQKCDERSRLLKADGQQTGRVTGRLNWTAQCIAVIVWQLRANLGLQFTTRAPADNAANK